MKGAGSAAAETSSGLWAAEAAEAATRGISTAGGAPSGGGRRSGRGIPAAEFGKCGR